MRSPLMQLQHTLDQHNHWIISVSGGLRSLTLASIAHRYLLEKPIMVHRVPGYVRANDLNAAQIRQHAKREGWDLRLLQHRADTPTSTMLAELLLPSLCHYVVATGNVNRDGQSLCPINLAGLDNHQLLLIARQNQLDFASHFIDQPVMELAA